MVATPLLAMTLDVKTAVLVLVLPTAFINAANILRGGAWKQNVGRYWPLGLYGMVGSFLGTKLLILLPPELFRPVLAGVILLYLNANRIGLGFSWIPEHPGMATAVFGIFAGILGGTVNVMLPALVIFALEMKMDKTTTIQVFNLCFLLGKLTQGVVFAAAGMFTLQVLKTALPLALLAVAVSTGAMVLRDRIPAEAYRKWLRCLLAVMAAALMFQTLILLIR